jgi:hypothetical protein
MDTRPKLYLSDEEVIKDIWDLINDENHKEHIESLRKDGSYSRTKHSNFSKAWISKIVFNKTATIKNPILNEAFDKFQNALNTLDLFLIKNYSIIDQEGDVLTLEYAMTNFSGNKELISLEDLLIQQKILIKDYEQNFDNLVKTLKEIYSSEETKKKRSVDDIFFYPDRSLLTVGDKEVLISKEALERILLDCVIKVQPNEISWDEIIDTDDGVINIKSDSKRAVRDAHNRINHKIRIETELKVDLIKNRLGNYKLTKKVIKR